MTQDPPAGRRLHNWTTRTLVLACLALLGLLGAGARRDVEEVVPNASAIDPVRRFSVAYEVEIAAREKAADALHVFLPIAIDTSGQRILEVKIDSPVEGRIEREAVYGNRFWHAEVPADHTGEISIRVAYEVERRVYRGSNGGANPELAERFLRSNDRVVVGHPVLDPILEEIRSESTSGDHAEKARAIYDWVVDNVEYKKVGTGWGNGDTFWACNERYGNCTDFHSLFISLARTEGIPAKFEMGFPIPLDRKEGIVLGYHCWLEFWLPDRGWVPVDASEASKHPLQRDLFFGTHPADRLQFTTGRDLRLGDAHRDRPLNYFIYPYVEIGGERSDIEIATRLRFRDRATGADS